MQKFQAFCPAIARQYNNIMTEEAKLHAENWDIVNAKEIWGTALQILEYTKASTVLRSYNWNYGLTDPEARTTLESDGGHTNLMSAIVDRALAYRYGPHLRFTEDGYTYREIMEAVRRHDLPENETGDIPDDGARDEVAKSESDTAYQLKFSRLSPSRELESEKRIRCLLAEMDGQSSPTGKLLYLADKVSAVIAVLACDALGQFPAKHITADDLTVRDIAEMRLCDIEIAYHSYLASEMWSIDYFKARRLVKYDEIGFFTALIVMFTLQVHGRWYSWREADYSNEYYS